MKKAHLPAMVALLLGSAPTIFAGNTADPIIVTATRTAQTANESLASVTVISRKDIERQQARSIQDLLRGVPGVSIANNGGPGKATSVFMRGTNSDHVLVLIDGIKVGSATLGGAAFENIPIEQIDRVEIVRGPRSSLYGSEAVGGVIQIFTRKGASGGGFKPNFSLGGGSYGTFNGSAGFSASNKNGWINLNASGAGTKGFNTCTGSESAGCFTKKPDTDRDGYRNVSGSFRAGYRFDSGLDIETNFLHSDGKSEFDESNFDNTPDSKVNKTKIVQQVFGGTARYSPVDIWRVSMIVGRSYENSRSFIGNVSNSPEIKFNTRRDTISFLNDITIAKDQLLTVGVDYQIDHIDSSTGFTETSRHNWGTFAQHQATILSHDIQASVRLDDNEQFGRWVTGGTAWGYSIADNLRITASFGSAFKAPTFNQLYFPSIMGFPAFGNANLRPEESRSFEVGINGKADWGNWSLNAYETRIDNLIAFDFITFAAANINQARIRGLEAVINTRIKGWQLNGNLTFLDPENRSAGANRGNILARRAEQTFRLDTNRIFFDKYTVGAMFLAEGERYDDLANTRKLDSYTRFDLRSEYHINKSWRLQGRIENLFDKQYETASFFNQPGRNFFITLRYQPSS